MLYPWSTVINTSENRPITKLVFLKWLGTKLLNFRFCGLTGIHFIALLNTKVSDVVKYKLSAFLRNLCNSCMSVCSCSSHVCTH